MLKAALITLLVGVATQADAMQPICKNGGHYQEGYCYWFAPLKVHGSWSDAGRDCRHLSPNTHLFRPSSQQQQDGVIRLLMTQYNISLQSNWVWAIDFNKLLDGVQWLNTDFSVPKYNTINDETDDELCGVLVSHRNNTMKQLPADCAMEVKAICQKKVCHHDNTDQPQCGFATHINNTAVIYRGGSGASSRFPEGTVATYECSHGFVPHGLENVTCLNTSTWSTTNFSCVEPQCGVAPHINNTIVTYSGGANSTYPEETVASYECADGFIGFKGFSDIIGRLDLINVTCLNTSMWSFANYSCIAACDVLENQLGIDPFSEMIDDGNNVSQLYATAKQGDANTVDLLLSCYESTGNISLIYQEYGSTPQSALHVTTSPAVLQVFIDHGVDLEYKGTMEKTALHFAVERNSLESVNVLLEGGASTDTVGGSLFRTALHLAAQNELVLMTSVLVEANASLDILDIYLRTALHVAVGRGNVNITQQLADAMELANSTYVNIQDSNEQTALHINSVQNGTVVVELATVLIDAGTDKLLEDVNGDTAQDIAEFNNHQQLATYLSTA